MSVLQSRELVVVVVERDGQNVAAAAGALATVLRGERPALPAHDSVVAGGAGDDVGADSMAQWPRSHAGPSFLTLRIPQPY